MSSLKQSNQKMSEALSADKLRASEFSRYSRQIMLSDWQEAGQLILKNSQVAIIGCGGLGTVVASYLAGSGVGQLTLIDGDDVELSNLPRQLAFDVDSCGLNKADELTQRLYSQNDEIDVLMQPLFLDQDNMDSILSDHDLIIDCSDNFTIRHLVNKWCVEHQSSLLSASVIGWHGQMLLVDKNVPHGCYHCLFDNVSSDDHSCENLGVASAMVGVVGSYQANQAIRYLLTLPTPLTNQLALIDGESMQIELLNRSLNPDCTVCGSA